MTDFQTPEKVCEYMVDLIPPGCYRVLEPTPGDGNLVWALTKAGHTAIFPREGKDYWEMEEWEIQPLDCVVANPPFTPATLGYKFLYNFMDICDKIIILMPWVALINSDSRTKELLDFGLVSVTHLPRKTFSGSPGNFCVLYLNKSFSGRDAAVVRFFDAEDKGPPHDWRAARSELIKDYLGRENG